MHRGKQSALSKNRAARFEVELRNSSEEVKGGRPEDRAWRHSFQNLGVHWLCWLLAVSSVLLARTAFQFARSRLISVQDAKSVLHAASQLNRRSIRLRRWQR